MAGSKIVLNNFYLFFFKITTTRNAIISSYTHKFFILRKCVSFLFVVRDDIFKYVSVKVIA